MWLWLRSYLPLQHLVMSESREQTKHIYFVSESICLAPWYWCVAPPCIWSIFNWLQFASCRVSYCILSRPPPCWLLAVKLKGLPVISARPIWDKSPSADLQISSPGNISLQTSLQKSDERLPFAGFWPSSGLQVLPRSYLSRTTLGQVSWCRRYPASNNVCKHVLNLHFISCIMVWTSFCFDPS